MQLAALKQNARYRFLIALLLFQTFFGLVYVFRVPLWMPSDERAHMRYVIDLATDGKLPLMKYDDTHYEEHHPPFYYAIAAVLMRETSDASIAQQGYAQRALCLFFFVSSTIIFWLTLMRSKHRNAEAITSFYALNPAMLGICASISNDSLSFLLCMVWAFLILGERPLFHRNIFFIGFTLATGMLTKLTCAPFALLSTALVAKRGMRATVINWLLIWIPIVVLIVPWIAHNYATYGHATATGALQDSIPCCDLTRFNYKSTIAYHFLPAEFWLNQVKAPIVIQGAIVALLCLATFGLVRHLRKTDPKSASGRFEWLCLTTYVLNFVPWFFMSLYIHAGPVRWIFGSFFAFSTMFCAGLFNLLAKKVSARVFDIGMISTMVIVNLSIAVSWLPSLSAGRLHP